MTLLTHQVIITTPQLNYVRCLIKIQNHSDFLLWPAACI